MPKPIFCSLLIATLFPLLACGARTERGERASDLGLGGATATAPQPAATPPTETQPTATQPAGTQPTATQPAGGCLSLPTPTPAPTLADVDPILLDPNLAPGVTSVEQPSFFDSEDSATTDAGVALAVTGDGGTTLEGEDELTVLLVFDKSSSMLQNWHGVTRWQVANESLRAALDGILDVLTIGVIRFPLGSQCGVEEFDAPDQIGFRSGRQFVELWQQMSHRLESLGTPLGAALGVADRAIAQAKLDGRLEHRFRVVLVTDGEPNCGENIDDMVHLVESWRELGVETLIIGIPGSEAAAETLRRLAEGGGTGTARSTADESELDGELHRALR